MKKYCHNNKRINIYKNNTSTLNKIEAALSITCANLLGCDAQDKTLMSRWQVKLSPLRDNTFSLFKKISNFNHQLFTQYYILFSLLLTKPQCLRGDSGESKLLQSLKNIISLNCSICAFHFKDFFKKLIMF